MTNDTPINPPTPAHDVGFTYSAFISYRHVARDQAAAAWLLKALETYRIPRDLRRSRGVPARVAKVFRDEDELPSSDDLNDSILRALEQSRVLIAICSPELKNSKWCRKEIQTFREWDRPVLALIVDGDPSSDDAAVDSFTPELRTRFRREVGPDGAVRFIAEDAEPIAADLRPRPGVATRHTRQVARVKIVAGLLGVRFDELWKRDLRRRRRRQLAWSTTLVLALAGAAFAVNAVNESRADASREGLARVAADLTSASLSRRDLDSETRALLALHALRLHDETGGGDLNGIDLALRNSLKDLGSLGDTVEWSVSLPVDTVVPMGEVAPGEEAAAAEGMRFLRGGGSAGGVMSVAFLPDDSALAFGLCSTPLNRRPRPFGLWSFPRLEQATLAGFAQRLPQTDLSTALEGLMGLEPTMISVSPTGRIAAIVSSDVVIRLRENDGLDESSWFRPDPLSGRTAAIAFDPTSDATFFRVAYAGGAGTVRICSVVLSQETTYTDLPAGAAVRSIAYRPDGESLAVGCDDGTVRIWVKLQDGDPPGVKVAAHQAAVNSVAFSPDGAALASAGDDGVVAVWDLGKPDSPLFQIRARVTPEQRVARAVAFSSRGDLAIGWSAGGATGLMAPENADPQAAWARPDGSVYLYRRADLASPAGPHDPVMLLPGESGGIRSLAFNREGSLLAAGCEDLSVHVWVAMPEDLVGFARRFVKRELSQEEWDRFTQNRVPLEPALPVAPGACIHPPRRALRAQTKWSFR